MSSASSQSFKVFLQPKILVIFLLGISSGFPKGMIVSNLIAWLSDEGLSRTDVGLFALVSLPYAINFLWAPVIDKARLPFLTDALGPRRAWMVVTQVLLIGLLILLSMQSAQTQLFEIAVLCVAIAFVSATQDIAIDAFRIESVPKKQQGAAASSSVVGWLLGNMPVAGIALLMTAYMDDWNQVYLVMSVGMCVGLVATFLATEPEHPDHAVGEGPSGEGSFARWIREAVLSPFVEFFKRNTASIATLLLLFIFTFKLGEAFLGSMSIRFYKEIGFTWPEVFSYVKSVGMISLGVGSFLGGAICVRLGASRGLLVSGVAMALTNFLYAYLAHVGRDESVLIACVVFDNFTSGISLVAFVTYLSGLCNVKYTATQYALLASLGNLGRTTLSAGSGWLVDKLGGNWTLFFILTVLMALPGLMMLLWLIHKGIEPDRVDEEGE